MTDETLKRLRDATGDIHAVDLEEHLRRIAAEVAKARGETDMPQPDEQEGNDDR